MRPGLLCLYLLVVAGSGKLSGQGAERAESDGTLLVVALRELGGRWCDVSELPSRAVVWACSEVDLGCRSTGRIKVVRAGVPGAQCPDAVDGERISTEVLEQAAESAGS